LQIADC